MEATGIIKPYSTTGIGSLPHRDAREAVRLVLETFDVPFWPQLPALGFRELMIPQYSEGLPGIREDESKGDVWVVRDAGAINAFYESVTDESLSEVSEKYAAGFYAFTDALEAKQYEILKGHVTGPITFTLGLKDENGAPIYFDEELRQIALMLLNAKVRWQVRELKKYADEVILFFDEPLLSALGSTSYVAVSEEEARRLLADICGTIKEAGGIPGVHCCGRADWPLALQCGADIVNFDSYDYASTLGIYPEELGSFLKGGGILGWGAVPTTEAIADETARGVEARFRRSLKELSERVPRELLETNIILTPSCGTGSRTEEETAKVFGIIRELKAAVAP